MIRKLVASLVLLSSVLVINGCTPPYRQTFNDEGKARGWTQKQTDAAFAYADRIFWSREVSENKYVITYGKVPTSKVREQLQGSLTDLDSALDPKNTEMRQYLDTFKLREDMKHDEEIAQAIYDRVHAAELQTQFKQKMGDVSEYGPEAEMAQGYNVKRIYVNKPLVDAFPFTSDVIDGAKKNGSLKQVATLTLDESNQYDHKEPNPKNPNDPNDFIWKARTQKIVLTEYKVIDIEKPLDNRGDYIEGYRVVEGKQEQYPAIKVFFPPSGDMAILLVDADQDGMPGFGVPDVIESISSQTNLTDLMQNQSLLNGLFDKKTAKNNRNPEATQLFKIEIAPLGKHIDEWQKSPDAEGWIVPFKYANIKGDNFNVRLHYKKLKIDGDGDAAMAAAHSEYLELEYIEKEYTKTGDKYTASAGRVIEYYRPKKEFAGKVKAQVLHYDDTKKLQFETEDGSVITGFVTPGKNKFIEDVPYAKSYNEGQKRFWIESSNSDGKYDKRKTVGPPKELTGEYYGSEMDEARSSYAARPNDNSDEGGYNSMAPPCAQTQTCISNDKDFPDVCYGEVGGVKTYRPCRKDVPAPKQ
jgi:hypothetical protein